MEARDSTRGLKNAHSRFSVIIAIANQLLTWSVYIYTRLVRCPQKRMEMENNALPVISKA